MTVEEALTQLRLGPGINEDVTEDYNDAVNIAIEALEQQSIFENIVEYVRGLEYRISDLEYRISDLEYNVEMMNAEMRR